jgi:NAD(P)-dependent dehydrogenase (short-subunit alcohol dehydrogenase family)
MSLKDRIALIVGAGSGIGAETARLLAERGATVAVADLSLAAAESVVAQVRQIGGKALALQLDIAVEDQIASAVGRTIEAFGRIDVLHNNAAITAGEYLTRDGEVALMECDVWDQVLRINLRGPMLCCKHVLPHMVAQRRGSIITSGSGRGLRGELEHSAYGVAKAGLIALTQNIATQYGKQGVRANIMAIGLVLSETVRGRMNAERHQMLLDQHLTPQLGCPTNVASTAAFLASDESSFITGAVIPVDGGWLAHSPIYADALRMRAPK